MTASSASTAIEAPLFVLPDSGQGISRITLMANAQLLANGLEGFQYCINLCEDRYLFTLGFCAGLITEKPNLLPANLQQRTLQNLVTDYGECVALVEENTSCELMDRLSMLELAHITVAKPGEHTGELSVTPELKSNSKPAAIVFTSGSTGAPTAIAKPWRTLAGTSALLCQRFLNSQRPTSIVATVPAQHMYGLETTIAMPLHGGCSVFTGRPFYPADIVEALGTMPAPRLLVTTPIHMKTLLDSGIDLPELGGVISATAPLDQALAASAEEQWDCSVREIYGCSEGGSLASRSTVKDEEWDLLPGISITERKAIPCINAPHLDDVIELQDELEITSSATFRFVGRGNDMLNIGGKRASLAQLNHQLLAIEGVEDGIIFLPDDSARQGRLAALIVSALPIRTILRELALSIDPVFLPRPAKKVAEIPRNSVGKSTKALMQSALLGAENDKGKARASTDD